MSSRTTKLDFIWKKANPCFSIKGATFKCSNIMCGGIVIKRVFFYKVEKNEYDMLLSFDELMTHDGPFHIFKAGRGLWSYKTANRLISKVDQEMKAVERIPSIINE